MIKVLTQSLYLHFNLIISIIIYYYKIYFIILLFLQLPFVFFSKIHFNQILHVQGSVRSVCQNFILKIFFNLFLKFPTCLFFILKIIFKFKNNYLFI